MSMHRVHNIVTLGLYFLLNDFINIVIIIIFIISFFLQ